jgi:hypothetical protein
LLFLQPIRKIASPGRSEKTSTYAVDAEISFSFAIQGPCMHYEFIDASCLPGAVYIACAALAMLLHFTSRTVDHSTEAIEMSDSPWPLVAVRCSHRGNSSSAAKSSHHRSSHGRRPSQHATFASDQYLVFCIRIRSTSLHVVYTGDHSPCAFFTLFAFDTTIDATATDTMGEGSVRRNARGPTPPCMVFANESRCATAKLRLLVKCRSLSPTQIQSTFVG